MASNTLVKPGRFGGATLYPIHALWRGKIILSTGLTRLIAENTVASMNSYQNFPIDEWDETRPARQPLLRRFPHYSKPSRNPGDLVAIMDRIVDGLPVAKKGLWK